MPKATLEFDLTDVEEARDFAIMQKGGRYYNILWNYDQWLRSEMKYKELTEEVHNTFQKARDKLHSMMEEYDAAFED